MTALAIRHFDDPLFRGPCKKVTLEELQTEDFQQFLDDFADTCVATQAVGLGAPQVGVHKRVIVINIDPKNARYPGRQPFELTWVINPKIIKRSKEIEVGTEGSVSTDELAKVPRHKQITVVGWDRDGHDVEYELIDPFHARVFQHEIGYLNDELFTDLARNAGF